jgi:hypothetical protein
VASFLIETYFQRRGAMADAVGRVCAAADAMSSEGVPVRYLRSIFVPEDETCFHLFEGPSAEAVELVGERAGFAGSRVVEAIS